MVSGAEFAEFVGGADENLVDGVDAATHLVRRPQLDQRLSDVDAEHVRGSEESERDDRQPGEGRQAEQHGESPE